MGYQQQSLIDVDSPICLNNKQCWKMFKSSPQFLYVLQFGPIRECSCSDKRLVINKLIIIVCCVLDECCCMCKEKMMHVECRGAC